MPAELPEDSFTDQLEPERFSALNTNQLQEEQATKKEAEGKQKRLRIQEKSRFLQFSFLNLAKQKFLIRVREYHGR